MNLIEDQMAALNDYTRESFASKADDVLSVQDEQEVLEARDNYAKKQLNQAMGELVDNFEGSEFLIAHAKWERDKLNEQFPKDEC